MPQQKADYSVAKQMVIVMTAVCLLLSTKTSAWPSVVPQDARPGSTAESALTALHSSSDDSVSAYYLESIDSGVQELCLTCHRSGGTASLAGARLLLSENSEKNHEAFAKFISNPSVDVEWVLAKTGGGDQHGGGTVLSPGTQFYNAFERYLTLLNVDSASPQNTFLTLLDLLCSSVKDCAGDAFWAGTMAETRETTLRRATLLFAGKLADELAITRVEADDSALREEIMKSMEHEGFRQFLINGADDRLLISGLQNGIDFNISTFERYPEFAQLSMQLPDERPEEFDDYHERPFLSRGDADWMLRRAVGREPLELIAHIVTNDHPYTDILTADYTMVNAFSDLAYRAEAGFSHDFADVDGFYDRRSFGIFRPGYNDGHIPHDDAFEVNEELGVFNFSGYQEWPHAGILSTQAWLARYPSTATNRNRARGRWTYFHFLGLDIERSAPRSTDPEALADTDNPTMKNRACTVCHERLDPIAGAFQSFGDLGHYLDQYGGVDSLSDAYKCPECYGGEWGSTAYQDGDTWYRDMRAPGFERRVADSLEEDSLQWLGRQIVDDSRFPAATVRFWWPSVFGAAPLTPPETKFTQEYEQQLRAFNTQDALINDLAEAFVESGYDLKSLLANMVMSPWYRHSEVKDGALLENRLIELKTVGRGRLLTPEELDRKNIALFGRTWRQWGDGTSAHTVSGLETALTGEWAPYKAFYGGMDGAAVTQRNRDMTALMSNVAETMAIDLSCQVVIEDFDRPENQRLLFKGLTKETVPGGIVTETLELEGSVDNIDQLVEHSVLLPARLVQSSTRIKIEDLTRDSHRSTDGQWTNAELVVRAVTLRQQGIRKLRLRGDEFIDNQGFSADRWEDENGEFHWRGQADGNGWRLHSGAWVEVEVDLPAGQYEIEVELATALRENNINTVMTARAAVRATRNLAQTEDGQRVAEQIDAILQRANSRAPTQAEVSALFSLLVNSASRARASSSSFKEQGNNCETWWVWPDEQLENDEYWARYGDSEGMMRAWSTLLHSVITSFGYLHD